MLITACFIDPLSYLLCLSTSATEYFCWRIELVRNRLQVNFCLSFLCSRSPIGTNHSNKYGHRQNNNIQSIKFYSFQLFWYSSTRNSDVLPNTTAFSNSLKILCMRFHGLPFPFEIRLAFYCLSPIICITRLHKMQTVVFSFPNHRWDY